MHWSEAGHELLVQKAANGDHAQPAIDEFGRLVLGEVCGRLAEAERVKRKLSRLARRIERNHLYDRREAHNHFEHADPEEQLHHAPLRDAPVVDSTGQLGCTRVEPKGILLVGEHTSDSEHANAGMLDLGLLKELDVEKVGEAERVEAGVARHGLVEFLRLGQEGDGRRHLHGGGGAGGDAGRGQGGAAQRRARERGGAWRQGDGGDEGHCVGKEKRLDE